MKAFAAVQRTSTPSSTTGSSFFLQRKCACRGPAGLNGIYDECSDKKLLVQPLQAKLVVGSADDPLEGEADRIVEQVMTSYGHGAVSGVPIRLQRFAVNAPGLAAEVPTSVGHVLASLGRPLEPGLRKDMERRFGYDFSRVRVHTGEAAEQSARALNARAYTVGRHIAFAEGQHSPENVEGKRLLAHELTHVLQQGEGTPGANSVSALQCQRQGAARPGRVRGPESDADVAELLKQLRARLPSTARSAETGRLIADRLLLAEDSYTVILCVAPTGGGSATSASGDRPEVETSDEFDLAASTRLGAGTFYLEPALRSEAGILALANGAAYRVYRIASDGGLSDTGRMLVTCGLGARPGGLLIYTTREMHFAPVRIVGSPLPDTAAVTARVLDYMDANAPLWVNPGITAMFLIEGDALLAPLQAEALMEVFAYLEAGGRLGELFNLVSSPRFRRFLRERYINWAYIFQNWTPSANDSLAVFAGVLVGAGENVYQVLELLGMLIGSVFSESLARDRRQFFAALGQLVQHPILTAEQGLEALQNAFENALWQLQFFDAGRIIGNLAVAILTLPAAIRSLPALARSAARLALSAARITLAAVEALGVKLADLARYALRPLPSLDLGGGLVLMMNGNDVLILTGGARPPALISRATVLRGMRTGRAPLAGATTAEIDTALAQLDELAAEARATEAARVEPVTPRTVEPGAPTLTPTESAPPASPPAVPPAALLSVADLEQVVEVAIRTVRRTLGRSWASAAEFGTRLHAEVADLIQRRFGTLPGLVIHAEEPIRAFSGLPATTLDMTIEAFVRANLPKYVDDLSLLFTRKVNGTTVARLVGDLKPDLVIRAGGELAVWDLTSRLASQHLAKTLLYARILAEDGTLVRIGETYSRHFSAARPFRPQTLYPAAFQAIEAQRRMARARRDAAGETPLVSGSSEGGGTPP